MATKRIFFDSGLAFFTVSAPTGRVTICPYSMAGSKPIFS
jgi:hypothetical protein